MPLVLTPITEAEQKLLCEGAPQFAHLAVKDFIHWRLYLYPDQTYLYRSYIWLIGEHTDLQQRYMLRPEQDSELSAVAWMVHRALAKLSKPDMINEFYAGNEYRLHRGHAHLHLIPRYFSPPLFGGRTFPDLRFGKNYAPHDRQTLLPDEIRQIRDSFADAIESAAIGYVG